MLDGRHYIVGDNVGVLVDLTRIPDNYILPGDDYMMTRGTAIGVKLHFSDVETDPVLCMTDTDVDSLIKALKVVKKRYRKEVRAKR
jgi:hypothetical protein